MSQAPLRPGESVRIRGQRWRVTVPGTSLVRVRGGDPANRHDVAAFLTDVERIERLPQPSVRVARPAQWRRAVRRILAEAGPPDSLIAARAARFELFPYQLEPALALIRGFGARLLIADEVGLGKTVQSGLIAAEVMARRREASVLIVSPAGLREQWQSELQRFDIAAALVDSGSLGATSVTPGRNPWIVSPAAIVSIDFVKRPEVIRSLEPMVWDLVVFDEAHQLGGHSDRAAAARALADRARALVLLTATPHTGDASAFERMADLGNLERGFPLLVFRRSRHDAGLTHTRRTAWLRVRPSEAERAMHDGMLQYARNVWSDLGRTDQSARLVASVLARRGCSSAASLARSLERRIGLLDTPAVDLAQLRLPWDDDGVDDRVLGAAGLSDGVAERAILDDLLLLARRAARAESKPAALVRLLRRARQPAIVFTEYRDTLTFLAGALAGFNPTLLHGALTRSERRDVVAAFTGGTAPLLLATDAASEGLNLHARCRLVINLELPWTPLRLEQRIGRVERIGQHRRVHAVHLVAAGTSEEVTVEALIRRSLAVERAVRAMRPPDSGERETASAVFGIDGPVSPERSNQVDGTFVVPDLREAAIVEAKRIVQARALAGRASRTLPDRPIVTRVARRLPFRTCCAFRFVLADARGDFITEWLTALAADSAHAVSAAHPRERLARELALFEPALLRHQGRILRTFSAALADLNRVASSREDAILRAVLNQQSRLALELVQRGLFDRRSERAADSRQAVLREACDRCRDRVLALRHLGAPIVDGASLAFAVLTD